MMRWNVFRDEVGAWSRDNFGDQSAINPFVGIVEEIGEILAAADYAACIDGVADAMVYVGDLTSRLSVDLDKIVQESDTIVANEGGYLDDSEQLLIVIGRAAHSILKLTQNIRCNEDHCSVLCTSLSFIIAWLRFRLPNQRISRLWDVTIPIWETVKQRNWKENKVDGSVTTDK